MEISTTRKYERQRIVAMLDSALALCFLVVCSFTLLFVYSINEEDVSEVFVLVLTVPLILNGLQLVAGIILLFLTRKSTRHLHNCQQWCSVSKYLTAFIFMEMFVLLQFQFKSLAFGLFGIQYLIRLVAIQKVRQFMESLILRNTTLVTATIIPRSNDIMYANIMPTNRDSASTNCQRLTVVVDNNSHCANNNFTTPRTHSCGNTGGRLITFDDDIGGGELHLQFQQHSRRHHHHQHVHQNVYSTIEIDELPPPSYTEAMKKIAPRPSTTVVDSTDAPPSYNEAVKARARMHWKIIALHRKTHGKCAFAQSFI